MGYMPSLVPEHSRLSTMIVRALLPASAVLSGLRDCHQHEKLDHKPNLRVCYLEMLLDTTQERVYPSDSWITRFWYRQVPIIRLSWDFAASG